MVATKVERRREFTGHPVQSLHFLKESPEKQGNLLTVTQLSGGWPEPGHEGPGPPRELFLLSRERLPPGDSGSGVISDQQAVYPVPTHSRGAEGEPSWDSGCAGGCLPPVTHVGGTEAPTGQASLTHRPVSCRH